MSRKSRRRSKAVNNPQRVHPLAWVVLGLLGITTVALAALALL